MAGWYHEKAWKQLVSTAISYSSAFTPEEQFSKAGICPPWRLWLGGYSYQHWTFSSGLMRQAGPVEVQLWIEPMQSYLPTVCRCSMNLVAQGGPFDARLRCFQTAAAYKAYTVSWQFRCEKKTHRYTELFSTKVEMRLPPCHCLG